MNSRMLIVKHYFAFITLGLLYIGATHASSEATWRAENKPVERDDIAIYTRQAFPTRAFRGVMQVPHSPLDVLAVLMDLKAYPDWVYQCETVKTQVIKDNPKLIYMAFAGIWPAKGRDLLVDFTITQTQTDGPVHIHVFTSEEQYAENEQYVRIPKLENHWYIKPLKDGWTEVEFQTQFSPGGKIPNWLMNMVMTTAPKKTMLGMRKQLTSGHYSTERLDDLPLQTAEIKALRFSEPNTLAQAD